jgi:hypothetical protein
MFFGDETNKKICGWQAETDVIKEHQIVTYPDLCMIWGPWDRLLDFLAELSMSSSSLNGLVAGWAIGLVSPHSSRDTPEK